MTLQERPPVGKYRLRVEDFVRLAEAGAFGDARTELIDGEIIVMAPEFRKHAFVRDQLAYRLHMALHENGNRLFAASGSILLADRDMPQPDIVVTSEPRGEGPIPQASIALLIEVSANTLAKDLGRKATLYAEAKIPEYWVVDVEARVIHQRFGPVDGCYTEQRRTPFGDDLVSTAIDGLSIASDGLI